MGRFILIDDVVAQKFMKRNSSGDLLTWSENYFYDIDVNTALRGVYNKDQFKIQD